MGKRKWIRLICCILAVILALGLVALTATQVFAAETRTGRITAENVSLRKAANTESERLALLSKGQEVAILGSSGRWYRVKAGKKTGYVRDDLLVVNKSAAKTTDSSKKGETGVTSASASSSAKSSQSTRSVQTALKTLGFYSGTVDGESGRQTAAALKAFQRAYGLTADGKAGEQTETLLNELLQTGGTGASAACIAENGEVILAEWYNAAKALVPKYEALPCVDVATGERFVLRCFSKGSHADVEPLTKADTDMLYRINGKRWSWTPRAIWVYFGGKCYAAAINMQPHGPDTLPDNGMKGQICMHFYCSRQHNTGAENRNLQQAVLAAFEKGENAPSWEEVCGAMEQEEQTESSELPAQPEETGTSETEKDPAQQPEEGEELPVEDEA